MNFRVSGENRAILQFVFVGLFLIGFIVTIYTLLSSIPPDAGDAQRHASGTRTAIVLTSQALLGPFPTSTAPTPTASNIPSATFTPTRTPTRTPTSTATPVVVITFTANTNEPRVTDTARPTARPTNTRVPPTRRPTQPTSYP